MKYLTYLITILTSLNSLGQVNGTIVDERDSTTYGTVTIDSLVWMTENLNFETTGAFQHPDSCNTCGLLYTYSAAKDVCPYGFRMPSESDWSELFTSLGGQVEVEEYGTYYHGIINLLQSEKLLDLRYCGNYDGDENDFKYCGTYGAYWYLNYNEFKGIHFEKSQYQDWIGTVMGNQYSGLSVRCVKDL